MNIGVPAILREVLLTQVDLEAYGHYFFFLLSSFLSTKTKTITEKQISYSTRKLTKSNQADAQAASKAVKSKKSGDLTRLLSTSSEAPIMFTYLKWCAKIYFSISLFI